VVENWDTLRVSKHGNQKKTVMKEFSLGISSLSKVDHTSMLEELRAVAQKMSHSVCGYPMASSDANAILVLYQGLDPNMRDRLMARSIEDMLAVTIRCKALSGYDASWYMFEQRG
jgi:hypothetical protein